MDGNVNCWMIRKKHPQSQQVVNQSESGPVLVRRDIDKRSMPEGNRQNSVYEDRRSKTVCRVFKNDLLS